MGRCRRLGPLTPPSPSLPPHTRPPGERGLEKAASFVVSLLAREGGREAGEEGRGGEGPWRRGRRSDPRNLGDRIFIGRGSPQRPLPLSSRSLPAPAPPAAPDRTGSRG